MSIDEVVLVDTSIWANHIDHADRTLHELLDDGRILMHPHVIGELAMGNLNDRAKVLRFLFFLPSTIVATDEEILEFISHRRLFGRGIGYVDAHLLAAVALTESAKLWTRDRRLREAAEELGLNFKPPLQM